MHRNACPAKPAQPHLPLSLKCIPSIKQSPVEVGGHVRVKDEVDHEMSHYMTRVHLYIT